MSGNRDSQSCSLRHATYLIRCAPHRPTHRPRFRQATRCPFFSLSLSLSHTSLPPSPAHPWLLLIILIDYHITSVLLFLPADLCPLRLGDFFLTSDPLHHLPLPLYTCVSSTPPLALI
jgi:hypothetical protein